MGDPLPELDLGVVDAFAEHLEEKSGHDADHAADFEELQKDAARRFLAAVAKNEIAGTHQGIDPWGRNQWEIAVKFAEDHGIRVPARPKRATAPDDPAAPCRRRSPRSP